MVEHHNKRIAVIAAESAGQLAASLIGGQQLMMSLDDELATTETSEVEQIVTPNGFYPEPGDGLPNRLSIAHDSPYFNSAAGFVGVRFRGEEIPGIVEYCVTQGWVKVAEVGSNGKVSAFAIKQAVQRYGAVEVFWKQTPGRQVRRSFARSSR